MNEQTTLYWLLYSGLNASLLLAYHLDANENGIKLNCVIFNLDIKQNEKWNKRIFMLVTVIKKPILGKFFANCAVRCALKHGEIAE
jgi:hypothetical protein